MTECVKSLNKQKTHNLLNMQKYYATSVVVKLETKERKKLSRALPSPRLLTMTDMEKNKRAY